MNEFLVKSQGSEVRHIDEANLQSANSFGEDQPLWDPRGLLMSLPTMEGSY
jgi:hypothetical protein